MSLFIIIIIIIIFFFLGGGCRFTKQLLEKL